MKKFKAEEYHPTKRARKMTNEKKMKLKMLRFYSQSLPVQFKMKTHFVGNPYNELRIKLSHLL